MKTCDTESCKELAVFTVFWPGQEKAFCTDCTLRAKNVANAMGFALSYQVRPVELDEDASP